MSKTKKRYQYAVSAFNLERHIGFNIRTNEISIYLYGSSEKEILDEIKKIVTREYYEVTNVYNNY